MPTINFKAPVGSIGSWLVVVLPVDASSQLSSRSMVMVEGTMNDFSFQAVLEPDGRGSHWLHLTDDLRKELDAHVGDEISFAITQSKDWPEPAVPADLAAALDADDEAHELWAAVTPLARWDWIRWIRATASQETREHRIEVAFSKLKHGERRPCCFNRNACTEFAVSKNGALLEPTVTD